MKVALVHDYIKEYGGAERVLEALHELWPQAPIFTTVYLPGFLGPHKARFENWDIRTSWLQRIPFKSKLISPLRLLAPFVFGAMNFLKFDVVIVSATGAYNPNLINKKSALQICYCHTPPRYLYGYPTAREWKKIGMIRVIGELVNHFLRIIDYKSSQNVDFFIANSKNVAERIKKFYRKSAVVIYPPVDVAGPAGLHPHSTYSQSVRALSGGPPRPSPAYFLTGGRLARPKRIDLAIAACTELKVSLKVFGKEFAGYGDKLREVAGPMVEFLGEISEEKKYELMRNAKAFIFPAQDEDFGITPVEAMMAGCPVIALRSGGVVESVVQNKTGVFFSDPTVDALVSALRQFDRLKLNRAAITKYAQKFNKARFKREIRDFVKKSMRK